MIALCVAYLLVLVITTVHSFNYRYRCSSQYSCVLKDGTRSSSTSLSSTSSSISSSIPLEITTAYLNSNEAKELRKKLVLNDQQLLKDMQSANFWTGGSFVISDAECVGISKDGIQFVVSYINKNKKEQRNVLAKFTSSVDNEYLLKNVLIDMALKVDQVKDTATIAQLNFGESCNLPLNFRWNDVPHHEWVRSFLYELATNAVLKAINDDKIVNKSRMVNDLYQSMSSF